MANNKMTPQPICSFCGRTSDEVERLIAGPGVYICNECIEVCDSILKEEHRKAEADSVKGMKLPVPQEIKKYLDPVSYTHLRVEVKTAPCCAGESLPGREKIRLSQYAAAIDSASPAGAEPK